MKCALIFVLAAAVCRAQGVISTVAGNGINGYLGDGGPAISASMHPNGVTVDAAGNIYIADLSKSVIRKVDSAGIITTVAGFAGESTVFSGDGGPATKASIYISSNHKDLQSIARVISTSLTTATTAFARWIHTELSRP
jgi:hypothetical protein